jgi:cell fate (sporulation/competence/biofilm development) regulator YlbF (YheA/YmcA/DUF963 family)
MSQSLHDVAYGLEKAIRNSEEYQQLKQVYDEVNNDESAKNMFDNFRNIQLELQQKQMQGQEITQEEVEQAQKTVALVQQHDKISKLMELEQRMSMLVQDVNKIVMSPLEELYGSGEEQQ